MSDFFKTRMGQRFYEHTMPELVKQLERLTARLDARSTSGPGKTLDELLLATYGLVNAAEQVLNVEIVPGAEETLGAFRNLRSRMETARKAADAIR
jgi:hypothetical protein